MRIELEQISKSFGNVRANNDISLTLEGGTIQGLLGENGAGKTTLMKILSGYQRYDSGRILLDGRPVSFRSPSQAIAQGIGMLHQDPLDVPTLSVIDNFLLGRPERRLVQDQRRAKKELAEIGNRFGFHLDPDVMVSSLTVGERQQLELVRLLSLGVRVLILDEPTTGISAPQKVLLFQTLHELAREGLCVVFVSHKLDEVEALCSRVFVLRQGQVVGHTDAPFSAEQLVQLMFGQCLSPSHRAQVPLGEVAVSVQDAFIRSRRLTAEHISLDVRQGEVIGLAGLEGSGQALLMQACAGIRKLQSGKIALAGRDMTRAPYIEFLNQGVSYVPAARLEEGLISGLTIREHAALLAPKKGMVVRWKDAEIVAEGMIRDFNIIGRPAMAIESLSGGNQQRTLLALLKSDIRLLILEHPTRGLDIESSRYIWNKLLDRRTSGYRHSFLPRPTWMNWWSIAIALWSFLGVQWPARSLLPK